MGLSPFSVFSEIKFDASEVVIDASQVVIDASQVVSDVSEVMSEASEVVPQVPDLGFKALDLRGEGSQDVTGSVRRIDAKSPGSFSGAQLAPAQDRHGGLAESQNWMSPAAGLRGSSASTRKYSRRACAGSRSCWA